MEETKSGNRSFWLIILAIFFGNFMAILSTTTINVAFPVFMEDFHAKLSAVQWMMAGFMLATGVIAPTVGFLGDYLSFKRLYIIALSGFTLFSVLCSIAWNIESLITFRIMQGVCSGIIMPTTMTMIYQLIEKEKQAFAMSLWSLSAMLAPAFGPTLGGWMTEYFGWESLFLINLPIGIIAIFVASICIPYYRMNKITVFDASGFITVIISSSSLLLAFSEGNEWGWTSVKTLSFIGLGLLSLIIFIRRELTARHPLLNIRVFKFNRFTFSLIINCIITASLYSGVFLIPIFMQNIQHATALDTALVLLPGSVVMAVSTPIIGKLYDKTGPFWLILCGILLVGFSTFELSHLQMSSSRMYVTSWLTLRYIGIAFAFMPVTNAGMSAIPRENAGHGSSVTNWIRQATGALSIGIFSSILAAKTIQHAKDMRGDMTAIKEHAMAMAVDDVFLIASMICAIGIPLTFLLRSKKNSSSIQMNSDGNSSK
ncbi:MDR family MFS transporter [Falsibacillus albus]|uniref:DHA2 family efflux MFS transporter permease subunit n=1 Tax=Falsibacillus albus TaxID=2478915 RepID=A0A3L7K0K9_9BACI|nr:MDR family MFS transporter [Falsibacillus albus]RLQ96125.1 DHA2 family efflux MFS transporter permease subunit [Falsibacillus albus]